MAVFLILYHVTGGGSNLLLAQCLYAVLYLLNLGVVVRIYGKVREDGLSTCSGVVARSNCCLC